MKKNKDLNTLRQLIRVWANYHGLLTKDVQPEKQMLKLVEEVGETARALVYDNKGRKGKLEDGLFKKHTDL
jgi:hypothetical protein